MPAFANCRLPDWRSRGAMHITCECASSVEAGRVVEFGDDASGGQWPMLAIVVSILPTWWASRSRTRPPNS